jgi:hypothetical protein
LLIEPMCICPVAELIAIKIVFAVIVLVCRGFSSL